MELTGGSEFLHRNFDGNQELATWDGELYLEMHRGTFTTKSNLKQLNRQMEFMLRNAELVLALRALSGKAYPGEELTEIYKKIRDSKTDLIESAKRKKAKQKRLEKENPTEN